MPRIPVIERATMSSEQARVHNEAKEAGSPVGESYVAYIRLQKVLEAAQNIKGAVGG